MIRERFELGWGRELNPCQRTSWVEDAQTES